MDNGVIHIEHAAVSWRAHVVLHDVSLNVDGGEFVGIIGPNGAGKTTLLTAVNGLAQPAEGTVRVLGVEPHRRDGYRLRRRIGYVAQVERIDPRLPISVRESVMAGRCGRLGWFRRPASADWARVDEVLAQVGMAHLAGRPIGQLSGGEYQRVAIARVLAQEPELFLFDEPTASIDPHSQHEILDLIERLHAESRVTSLYVTHDLTTLPGTCERLVLMKDGRIWRDGARETMLNEDVLRQLYSGGAQTHAAPGPAGTQR